jgi:hypothetical protein
MALKLGFKESLRGKDRKKMHSLGGPWKGAKPTFKNLRWTIAQ